MKFLKTLLIILIVLAGLILIIPVFLPSEVTLSAEADLEVNNELLLENLATYTDRDRWDPWLTSEPEAEVSIKSMEDLVGSTYAWSGEKIGSGRMEVDSIHSPDYIRSYIWFGESPEPSLVEWNFMPSALGTHVTWSFTSEGSYPFGRYMLLFMKSPLKKSFEKGLENLKEYLQEHPLKQYKLEKIDIQNSYDTYAMVVPVEGTMEEITQQFETQFPLLYQVVSEQNLTPNGPAFAHYLDFDHETGYAHVLLAAPVKEKGKISGSVKPKHYDAIEAVVATMVGEYQYISETYEALQKYVSEKGLEITGEAFEVYATTMMDSEDPMDWKTMIAFPLK